MHEERYVLSKSELMVLLAAKGMQNITIQGSPVRCNDSEMCYLINDMVQNGLIEGSEEKFVIEKDLDALLCIIKDADWTYLVRTSGDIRESVFIYQRGEDFCLVGVTDRENARYSLRAPQKEEVKEILLPEGYGEEDYVPTLEEEKSFENIIRSKEYVQPQALARFANIPYMLEIMHAGEEKLKERILLRLGDEEGQVYCNKEGQISSRPFIKEEFSNLVSDLIGEYIK
ncbi:MAG: hypothetical protein K5739_07795 [Lachnospiraceae bacterium]|nr:hypothetical protein [Lachnospiraceae bacterium]